jgi:hypothetical protein
MKRLVTGFLFAALSWAAGPRVIYTKSFPGSNPAYMAITVETDGSASYKEAIDDDPDTLHLEPNLTKSIFDLAARLDHFHGQVESGLKVANMGAKTFRWEDGGAATEARFNYSTDENARQLQDIFERISESQRAFTVLKRAIRYDRLGVHDALIRIATLWDQKRLAGTDQLLPLFDRVAKDESFIHMARERAASLADAVRALPK